MLNNVSQIALNGALRQQNRGDNFIPNVTEMSTRKAIPAIVINHTTEDRQGAWSFWVGNLMDGGWKRWRGVTVHDHLWKMIDGEQAPTIMGVL